MSIYFLSNTTSCMILDFVCFFLTLSLVNDPNDGILIRFRFFVNLLLVNDLNDGILIRLRFFVIFISVMCYKNNINTTICLILQFLILIEKLIYIRHILYLYYAYSIE